MIRAVGSVYEKVEFVESKMIVKIGDQEYVVENEWVKIKYRVTKKGDMIIGVSLPTEAEIEQEKKVQGIIELDKELQELWKDVKVKSKDLKNKVQVKSKELLAKLKNKMD